MSPDTFFSNPPTLFRLRGLAALAAIDPRGARVVELRFFSGLTVEETAAVLEVSAGTVKRDWNTARAWLYREIGP
jgi:RNA polymerase sigma factor (sigma-70 family)